MFKLSLKSIAATWLTGLLALLPLALTMVVLAWLVSLLNNLIGPSTAIGRLFAALGTPFASNPYLAYLLGTLVLLISLYPLGLAVKLGLRRPLGWLIDVTLRRTPLIGNFYNLADRFVGLLDKKNTDITSMRPVWCFSAVAMGWRCWLCSRLRNLSNWKAVRTWRSWSQPRRFRSAAACSTCQRSGSSPPIWASTR